MSDRYWVVRFDPARLRAVRKERGLSQEQLAERLGQDRVTIVKYEAGSRSPRASTVTKMATVLDIDVKELARPGPLDLPLLRARHGLSQADAAKALTISRALYQRVEARQSPIDDSRLRLLAQLLETDPDAIAQWVLVRTTGT